MRTLLQLSMVVTGALVAALGASFAGVAIRDLMTETAEAPDVIASGVFILGGISLLMAGQCTVALAMLLQLLAVKRERRPRGLVRDVIGKGSPPVPMPPVKPPRFESRW